MLTKYSLQKQLVIIFSIIAIGVLAILLPIIDNNLTHVIDNEMYDVLTRSQNDFYSYDFSPDYAGSDKQIYHFTYNINEDTLTTAQNISAKKYQILDYVFQNDLYKMVKKNKKKLQEKVKMQDQTVYYQIVKADDSNYIISIVYSEYSKSLINSLKGQVINIFYGALFVIALVLFIWVSSLIKPLKLIKNYIDDIKEDKESTLHIDRRDEIGIVSSSLIEMKEEIDKQNEIKEEMIHNISHDLKTPIALIQTYAQSIKDDVYPYGDKDSSVDVILENTNRLEKKVRSLLYLNRLDYLSGQVGDEVCSMKELIEHIVYQLNAMHPDIEIITELQDTYFKGDEEYWRICIENIIENASRYVNHTIKVILKNQYLEIFNDGEPIDNSNPESLFQPYEIGHKGQFGLGLSIVYKTVTMYGFKVEALNRKDGVSFVIHK
ncbi:MAG: histidine kinase dimerization/phospho-acceptor domain-containing protein [Faecalibacillus faecis]